MSYEERVLCFTHVVYSYIGLRKTNGVVFLDASFQKMCEPFCDFDY